MTQKVFIYLGIPLFVLVVVLPLLLGGFGVERFWFASVSEYFRRDSLFLRSLDRGRSWENVSALVGQNKVFLSDIAEVAFSPVEPHKIFIGTRSMGFWKSVDVGKTWKIVEDNLRVLRSDAGVFRIRISTQNPEIIYLAIFQENRGRVLRSSDGGVNFGEVYFESEKGRMVSDISLDPVNDERIFIINDRGGLFESDNSGISWQVIKWFGEPLQNIVLNPKDPRQMFIVTASGKFFKSIDSGSSWQEIEVILRGNISEDFVSLPSNPLANQFVPSRDSKLFLADPNNFDILYSSSKQGLFRSRDGGVRWEEVQTLVSLKDLSLRAISVTPGDSEFLWLGADSQIHFSDNAGIGWNSRLLSIDGGKGINKIFISPHDPDIMFVTTN